MRYIDDIWTLMRAAVCASAAFAALAAPAAAGAQLPGIVRTGLGFLNTGGYFFTGSGGNSNALGNPKFYSAGGFFTKPHHIGNIALSGGLESVNASDHFFPFTGGNEFNLIGPAARASLAVPGTRIRPFVTFGLFAGRVREVNRFDVTEFTPSGSVGVEVGLSRNFSLIGSYRISQQIRHTNTDGFGISLKIF